MINDSIIDFVIIIGNIGGGTICMIIALLYCQAVSMSSFNTAMLVSLGAFTGYLLFSLSMEVVSSAVVAVYVCFAEKPALFQVIPQCDSFVLAVKYTVYLIYYLSGYSVSRSKYCVAVSLSCRTLIVITSLSFSRILTLTLTHTTYSHPYSSLYS